MDDPRDRLNHSAGRSRFSGTARPRQRLRGFSARTERCSSRTASSTRTTSIPITREHVASVKILRRRTPSSAATSHDEDCGGLWTDWDNIRSLYEGNQASGSGVPEFSTRRPATRPSATTLSVRRGSPRTAGSTGPAFGQLVAERRDLRQHGPGQPTRDRRHVHQPRLGFELRRVRAEEPTPTTTWCGSLVESSGARGLARRRDGRNPDGAVLGPGPVRPQHVHHLLTEPIRLSGWVPTGQWRSLTKTPELGDVRAVLVGA